MSTQRTWLSLALVGLAVALLFGTALAADFHTQELYRLPPGETVEGDLYVWAQQVIIDGTVNGDLVAAAGYIEINGDIAEDLLAAAAGIVLNGTVGDDARLAGAGIAVNGAINDDLLAAAGGDMGPLAFLPVRVADRAIVPGLRVADSARIGGDAAVAAGSGLFNGTVAGNLTASVNTLAFGGQVAGDATLQAEALTVDPAARVDGRLSYASPAPVAIDPAVTDSLNAQAWTEPTPQPQALQRTNADRFVGWLWRTFIALAGLALLAWLLLRLLPDLLLRPAAIIETAPIEAGVYGLLIAAAIVPISIGLVFVAVFFWGWFPAGFVVLAFLFGIFGLLWLFSPLVTGLWIGRKLSQLTDKPMGTLASLLLGIAAIFLSARLLFLVPCVGELAGRLVYLLSFALLAGAALIRALHLHPAPTSLMDNES